MQKIYSLQCDVAVDGTYCTGGFGVYDSGTVWKTVCKKAASGDIVKCACVFAAVLVVRFYVTRWRRERHIKRVLM